MTTDKPILRINPPPNDACCEVCHKHISKLKPFGKAGDPLVGDFNGQLLLKTFRPMAPHESNPFDVKDMMEKGEDLTEAELTELKKLDKKRLVPINDDKDCCCYNIDFNLLTKKERARLNELESKRGNSHLHLNEEKFLMRYEKENLDKFYFHDQLENTIEASWECRDCIVLDDDNNYFKLKYNRIGEKNDKRKRKSNRTRGVHR